MKYSLLILWFVLASNSTTQAEEGYGISSWEPVFMKWLFSQKRGAGRRPIQRSTGRSLW